VRRPVAAGQRAHPDPSPVSLAVEIGRRDLVEAVLSEASESKLDALDRARVALIEEITHTRPLESTRYMWLIAAAENAGERRDHDLHVDLL